MDKVDNFFKKYKETAYSKGEIILQPNEAPLEVYYVKSGIVRLYSVTKEGNEITFNLLKPQTYFSMMSILTDSKNIYFFEALTDVTVLKCPKAEFLKFIKSEPEVLFDLSKRVLSGLNGLLHSIENLMTGKAENKIKTVITMLARRFGEKNNAGVLINLPLTHQQIANIAGLTRETTSLEMGRLAKSNIISYKHRRIIVKDLESLEKESSAQSSPTPSPIVL